jgi:chromosome segregation ATPase
MATTRELTREAAFRMLMDGSKPSINKIREILGKGSDKTIMDGLNEFWDELGQLITDWRTYPKLPNELAVAMNEWWQLAMKQSHRELESDRIEMSQTIALSEAKADKALLERDQTLKRVETLEEDNDKLKEQLKNIEQSYQQARTGVATLQSEKSALTISCKKLDEQLKGNEKKHQESLDLAYHRAESTESSLAKQIDDWKTQVEKLQSLLSSKETELKVFSANRLEDAEKHQVQLNKSTESINLLSHKNDQLTKTIAQQDIQLETQKKSVKNGNTKVKKLEKDISALESIISGFEAKEYMWENQQQQFDHKFDQLLEKMNFSK